ncbi:hypothetical protein [Vibrio genomosp. F10]|uniref:hypothetical protein n=1 Tax=Vibrio genomosp. F10 TaxID=723171 RepID=UPI0003790953|nr:hypothetical protein [Vibrio genomosp. F10]OEF13417.1 hypothetical protein A1QK_21640 [Vibrio genomosp. F10 str. 9ZD137]
MKKGHLLTLTFGFILFIFVGSKLNLFGSGNSESFPKFPKVAGFTVSDKYDGQWVGRRINTTSNNMCERTTITGNILGGKASLLLTYNGTPLQGWVSEQGQLILYANHRQWDYRFSGEGLGSKITGKWHLTNGPCRGTWYIERKA